MKFRLAMAITVMFIFASTTAVAVAQEAAEASAKKPAKASASKLRTLTGCLAKGDEAGEFHLTTKAGATWDLESTTVKLDEHVGHTVKVTGKLTHPTAHAMKEEVKEGAKKVGVAKEAKEAGDLSVTKLTHISDTCKP